MKEIEGIDLNVLVEKTSTTILEDKEKELSAVIRGMMYRQIALQQEIKTSENKISKDKEKLEKIKQRITKIKAGDWSVLEEKKEEKETHSK